MRLTEQEKMGLMAAIEAKTSIAIQLGELRLYGSRTDDAKKGGDIDLLFIVPNLACKKNLIENKHQLLAQMKKNIGDRKIDLLICQSADIELDPFIDLIYPTSVLLKKW